MAQHSARAVANFFIQKSLEDQIDIDHLKLQKLVYFAYAWWCGNFQTKDYLFDEEIEAWPHGPVIRDLYVEFCDLGRNPIRKFAQTINYDTYTAEIPKIEDTSIIESLLDVWNAYKKFSGIQLSNLTHKEDEPWHKISNNCDLYLKPRIPPQLIKDIYTKKVQELNSENSNSKQ